MPVENISIVEVRQGPVGPAGTNGSDATVTAANVALVINDALAADPAGSRDTIAAQSTAIGFLDRFDRSDRYSSGSTITHLSTTPETGAAWRTAQTGATAPTVVNGGLVCASDTLFYLSNSVATPFGKFCLAFDFSSERTAVFTTAVNSLGLNVTFGSTQLIDDARSIVTGLAALPIHTNIREVGISSCQFGTAGTNLTCLNATFNGTYYPWNTAGDSMAVGKRMMLLFRVNGDVLEITLVGVGTLLFTHPDVSTKIGATTYFWWEPNGPDLGSDYKYVAKLYRVWAGAEELDQLAGWGSSHGGNVQSLIGGGPHALPGRLNLYPNGASLQNVDALPAQDLRMVVAAISTTTLGARQRANGGHIFIEGGYLSNVGNANAGNAIYGRAPANADPGLTTALSSSAAAGNTLFGVRMVAGLANGDQQEIDYYFNLVGTNAKRIVLVFATYGGTILDTDTGTPIPAGLTGPCHLKVFRHASAAASHLSYAVLTLPDGTAKLGRVASNHTTNDFNLNFNTTCDAGAIVLEAVKNTVHRIKNN